MPNLRQCAFANGEAKKVEIMCFTCNTNRLVEDFAPKSRERNGRRRAPVLCEEKSVVTMFVLCAVEPGHVDACVGAMARRAAYAGATLASSSMLT